VLLGSEVGGRIFQIEGRTVNIDLWYGLMISRVQEYIYRKVARNARETQGDTMRSYDPISLLNPLYPILFSRDVGSFGLRDGL
jgi:hypothetical protein